jgi:carbonic anhydrase
MSNIAKLVSGFNIFKVTTYQNKKDIIAHLIEQGQKPTTMVISCVDIRLSPTEIFATNPGELYILNNMGGLVPKYSTEGIHGILSAIEYAVTVLEVENIVVLGHAKCESIKMMLSESTNEKNKKMSESMRTWLSVAKEASDATQKNMAGKNDAERHAYCEQESLVISMRNLLTYPYIVERMKKNKLNVHGVHFNIETGEIIGFNPDSLNFETLA